MLILFDNGTPKPLRRLLVNHTVKTAYEQGWAYAVNGELLRLAEEHGFTLIITTDTNMRYQQNMKKRKIGLIVLMKNDWTIVKRKISEILAAVSSASPAVTLKSLSNLIWIWFCGKPNLWEAGSNEKNRHHRRRPVGTAIRTGVAAKRLPGHGGIQPRSGGYRSRPGNLQPVYVSQFPAE